MKMPPSSYEEFQSIQEAFERVSQALPHHTAIKICDREISFKTLNHRANACAAHLIACGVCPGDFVALHMARCVEMVVAMLAILKCGGAYYPIDSGSPPSRNAACLDQTETKIVIADCEEIDVYAVGRRWICTNREAQLFNDELTDFDSHQGCRDDKAYVMFTSGSTGQPKGVVVPHRAVLRLVIGSDFINISPSDRVMQFAPPSFDAATFEFWGAMLNGACLVLYSGSVFDPNLFRKEMGDNNVSILWLTAALFHLVTESFIEALQGLRVLLAGGDVLNVRNVNKVLDVIPNIKIINGYGPTENTTFTCCHVMSTTNRPNGRVPIGRAIHGTRIHVLNPSFLPVQQGEEGELFASGDGVALGYLGGALSNRAFFANADIAPGLIYRTGDIVKENENGEIEFIGRTDNQIKLRGYRVSLEDIRENLVKIDGVSDALVLRKNFASGDQLLSAYVKCRDEVSLTIDMVREALAVLVPEYMVPDQIIIDSSLPINRNGKLDRASIERSISKQHEVS